MGKQRSVDEPPRKSTLPRASSDPVPSSVVRGPHNLPAEISSFVGRDQELVELEKLVGAYRLVTLTGSAGIGKTRLAVRLAAKVAAGHPDGVWMVALAPVADASLVPKAVADALSVGEKAGGSLGDSIEAALRERRLLLVMDNCEHLVGACAELVERLLKSCPGVRILATSQQPLRIPGEKVWRVPALSFPDMKDDVTADELVSHDAVRLFCDRATETLDGFTLTPQMAPAVADICRRLDGVPLALELAASRISVLSPDQIAGRLEDRFSLLTTGNRNGLPRHQTLLTALEWSHTLLSVPEQVLLARLSVFVGGWILEAAEEVCAGGLVERAQVFDLLSGLVAKSVVAVDASSGHARYRLLESLRHYAHQRLVDVDEAAEREDLHGWWCIHFYEHALQRLTRRPQHDTGAWLELIDAEHQNFIAALERALARGAIELALKLIGVLTPQWWWRGEMGEGEAWAERVIAESQHHVAELRAEALLQTAHLATSQGHFEAALRYVEEASRIAHQANDEGLAIRALASSGFIGLFLEDPAHAQPALEEASGRARAFGDERSLVGALSACGRGHLFAGNLERAGVLFEELLEMAAGDRNYLAMHGLIGTGWVDLVRGELGESGLRLTGALEVARDLSEPYGVALSSCLLGEVTFAQGRYEEALLLLEQSQEVARSLRAPFPIAKSACALGNLALEKDDLPGAEACFDEALSVARSARQKYLEAYCLLGQGATLEKVGDLPGARTRFDQALCFALAYGDKVATGRALNEVGRLAGLDGDGVRATACHHEALVLQKETGDRIGLVDSLQAIGGLAAAQRKGEKAARLFGAAKALRSACCPPPIRSRYESYQRDRALLEELLTPEQLNEAWAEGSALTVAEAIAYALKGRGRRGRPTSGWSSLTPAEHEVVNLVEQGLSNVEIGERLFISRRTVGAHLSHIFQKLGVTSRIELARQARHRDP